MIEKRMSRGNGKLDKSILCWAITPIASCLNCKQCASDCYAVRPYHRWPCVQKSWDKNFELAKTGEFTSHVINQIEHTRACKTVRIHVAGDFFSAKYIENWTIIAERFPWLNFYSYTKVWDIFKSELDNLNALPNCNIINSIAPDGKVNFGDEQRIAELVAMGYTVCPAIKHKDYICGKDCTACVFQPRVCFPLH